MGLSVAVVFISATFINRGEIIGDQEKFKLLTEYPIVFSGRVVYCLSLFFVL